MECSVFYAIYVIAHIRASTRPVPTFSPSKVKSTAVSTGLPLPQYVNRGVESRYVPSASFGRNQKLPNHSLP